MRILHFCNYADRFGGAEVYAHALVDALRGRGHQVALFGSAPDRDVNQSDLRVVERPHYDPRRLIVDPAMLAALDDFVLRFRPEVIHAHNVFSIALEVVDRLSSYGLPLLQTVHDFHLLCPNSWCVRGDGTACPGGAGAQCFQHGCQKNYPYDAWTVLLSALRQRMLSTSTRIAFAPSSYLADRLRANGWQDVRKLPYFIDFTPVSEPVVREKARLLYVGRLEKEKGVQVLIRALPEIRRSIPEVHLDVIGSGRMKATLARLSRANGVHAHIRYLDQIQRTELAGHYARATACVLPSIWTENSPLVAYECLLSGTPMIGSRIGGITELIEPDCGVTARPGDWQDLAEQSIRLLGLPEERHRQMTAAAHERSQEFARDEHVSRVEAAYADALAMAPPERAPEVPTLIPVLEKINHTQHQHQRTLRWIRDIARAMRLPKLFQDADK